MELVRKARDRAKALNDALDLLSNASREELEALLLDSQYNLRHLQAQVDVIDLIIKHSENKITELKRKAS